MSIIPSLEELCYNKLTDVLYNAPPLLQENIIGTTKEKLEEKIMIKLKKQVETKYKKELENNISENMNNILPYIIPDICSDMITSLKSIYPPPDFYEKYNNIPKHIVTCAIISAENIVRTLEERYIYNENLDNDYDI